MLGGIFALVLDTVTSAQLDAVWSNISTTSPTEEGSNEDRTITWGGPDPRSFTASNANPAGGDLQYRIDSGAWTAYSGAFNVNSGQTVGWNVVNLAGNGGPTNVTVADATLGQNLDTFNVTASGW